jgi:DnaJ-class molecular chaperone
MKLFARRRERQAVNAPEDLVASAAKEMTDQEPAIIAMQCPLCKGDGSIRGPFTGMRWYDCAYCQGTGEVSAKRFYAWDGQKFEQPGVPENDD